MATKLSFEKSRSFSIPYEKLFRSCERALIAMNLKITRLDETSGVIEAEKPVSWPFKSDRQISVAVRSDGRVKAIGKLRMGRRTLTNLSAEDLITEKFFESLQNMI
ncbi:MAG: hypothetical protein ACLQPD_17920 [Desulfomonilaceae bacterium]